VWRTRVGYAGGTSPDPTYHRLGDHSECVQVDFDPARVSYDDLLGMFWQLHDARRPAYSEQYASLVLAQDEEQLAAARAFRDRLAVRAGSPLTTRIAPLEVFTPAEDYHQKYRLRSDRALAAEFRAMLPDQTAFRESTAAARVNGYMGGGGSPDDLAAEIDLYGLSEAGRERLLAVVTPGRP
jgi:peptide-methionine (S)-S-oxide reductase